MGWEARANKKSRRVYMWIWEKHTPRWMKVLLRAFWWTKGDDSHVKILRKES